MRRIFPACLSVTFCLLAASPGRGADVRTDLIDKIADIVAIGRLCPALAVDLVNVTTLSRGSRIGDRAEDYAVIETLASARQGAVLRAGLTDRTCREAERRYGPEGVTLPGMLRQR
ncbi:hypothetical protein SAMN05880582_101987 [Rhizobium sp. RU20A]|uniref:hypothetical protein n=1 Tax=Rhizobium sp. RU20A TaxID=1907412 RepID=UPI0009549DDD|nr:hypothetical protein [Rhizobium sp. RU20A]SIQ17013.1 hypothetical protein SAMN05880582_101987 [Rhizobium sp. RU20A]